MLYFLIYLFLEVVISSEIAGRIGGLNVFFEILLTAIIGVFILKNFKLSLTENIQKARTGKITQEEFIKANAGRAIGAFLLMIPGFFTDIIGIMLQFSFFVLILSKIFTFKTPNNRTTFSTTFSTSDFGYDMHKFRNTNTKNTNNTNYKRNTDEIIDVEVIDDNNTLKH
ncbi:MAG: FxsA protein [Arcobacter sp.]|nr:MAG: FxsA protein [Arcobacter sp.]